MGGRREADVHRTVTGHSEGFRLILRVAADFLLRHSAATQFPTIRGTDALVLWLSLEVRPLGREVLLSGDEPSIYIFKTAHHYFAGHPGLKGDLKRWGAECWLSLSPGELVWVESHRKIIKVFFYFLFLLVH